MNIYKIKKEYENIPLPENLNSIVEKSIEKGERVHWGKRKHTAMVRTFRAAAILAAAMFILLIIMSNTSREFVMAASKIPVLGQLVKIVTWQDYREENENSILNVRLPKLENANEDNLENRINNEIRVKINGVLEEAEKRAEEYKQAFLDTGGKEEDWYSMEINIDYEVKCNNDVILSFVIEKSESYASVYTEKYYYNIDLETGKDLKLSDILGPNYVERANEVIKESIEERVKNGETFFGYGTDDLEEWKFVTISDETKFYVNDKGQAVIVFDKYEIAPGYMGFVEFTIE